MTLSEIRASLEPDEQVVGFYGVDGEPAYIKIPALATDSEALAAVFAAKHGRPISKAEVAIARVLENAIA
jgi:hypothetical protein